MHVIMDLIDDKRTQSNVVDPWQNRTAQQFLERNKDVVMRKQESTFVLHPELCHGTADHSGFGLAQYRR
jgi:hypothetical protein